ncbi:DUF1292 domain-containing protein [Helcococcus ovis]|uniref:DUF1292 domain-containing protein n=1 Tax=Helcococcus ovis TaxID=72026 RepID=A0A4R9C1Z7_9FIRM|nr:DUF1292 domain-containing protein [Helcococcus ovis]TFF64274.1 DUF1292 domain-containing protein [Helcococcus ovis]TFF66437.1 DUF1292 domain-containing protein [Helcococcus ovis]
MENKEYIEISDGEQTLNLLIVDTFGVDEKDYAALLDEKTDELYLFEIKIENEEVTFKTIENEKELEEILAIYHDLLESEDEEIEE